MTPLRVGGENGGARLVPLSMLPHLSTLAPEVRFTLLTNEQSHEQLADLDRSNVRRRLVTGTSEISTIALRWRADPTTEAALPSQPPLISRLWRWQKWPRRNSTPLVWPLADLQPDVMLCPFTAPYYYDPSIPVISIIYDLQYLYYPKFFTPEERVIRQRTFVSACHLADRLICISDYVRQTVLANSHLTPERVVSVHLGPLQQLPRHLTTESAAIVGRLGITADRFLLFPSNFWPHKNHRMLLTALGIYRSWHPNSDLKVVCTGTPDHEMQRLREAADSMGQGEFFVLPGFVTDGELATLYQTALGLVFPSLYEGFGMPVLEAMAFDTPVLCSNVTSLPEIVGDAALFFDPRKPVEIARAIGRLETESELRQDLIQRGRQRVTQFADGERLARTYLGAMRELVDQKHRQFADGLHGVHSDGWIGQRLMVSYGAGTPPRALELVLRSPAWLPVEHTTVSMSETGSGAKEEHTIPRGEPMLVRRELASAGGLIELRIEPVTAPNTIGMNDDPRELGCICEMARLIGPGYNVDLLETAQVWLTRV